jgi:hypothetical protein
MVQTDWPEILEYIPAPHIVALVNPTVELYEPGGASVQDD